MKKLFFILLSIQLAFAVESQQLTSGETVNKSVKKTEKHYYKITVPKNKSIHVNLTNLEADVDLYVKKGNEVRIRLNDCYSSNSNTEKEECILTNEGKTSEYSILVYGFKESSYTLKTTIDGAEKIPTLTDKTIQGSVGHKESNQYKFSAKKDKLITVTLSNLSADADLRIKAGRKAGLRTFDCKSTNGGTEKDECTITPKKNETIYVQVYGYKAANYSLKVTQKIANQCITIDELKKKIKDNEDVSHVNTSCITNMDYLFNWHGGFNQDISSWDVSHVTSMNHMFTNAESFNQDLSSWNTSNVTNMNNMFSYASSFSNNDLSNWNVDKVSSKKYFSYSTGDENIEPKWKDLNTVLINRAKEHCQNVHIESNNIVCSDVNNLVYLINSENDIGASSWIDSKTYAIDIKNNQETIKLIDSSGEKSAATLIKLKNTSLIAIDKPQLHMEDSMIIFYNNLGEDVLSRKFRFGTLELKELKTIKNGSEMIITYEEETNNRNENGEEVYTRKNYKDTYDISNTSDVKLISHIEL
jgi:surface protein